MVSKFDVRPNIRVTRRLCRIAARLGVPVVSVAKRHWPTNGIWPRTWGIYISGRSAGTRALLAKLKVEPPVIVLQQPVSRWPMVLAHEVGHAASAWCDYFDERLQRGWSPRGLLARIAERHGLSDYVRSKRSELRAECVGRRLLGQELPPTLRRFTERAYRDALEKRS